MTARGSDQRRVDPAQVERWRRAAVEMQRDGDAQPPQRPWWEAHWRWWLRRSVVRRRWREARQQPEGTG
jgi:hypothetical protein